MELDSKQSPTLLKDRPSLDGSIQFTNGTQSSSARRLEASSPALKNKAVNSDMKSVVPDDPTPVVSGADLAGPAVSAHLPLHATIYQSAAFALSALLSPYLVIPIGTFAIVIAQPASWSQLLRWSFISILFSTIVPAIYVGAQVLRGKITDIHVMEREQRDGPFMVAIASSFVGAAILWSVNSLPAVWGLGLVIAINGVVLFTISNFWKISMHVSVLSATVLVGVLFIDGINPWRLLWLIPVLIWARVARQRHTLLQGVAACGVAWAITGGVLYFMGQEPRFISLFERL
jgi:hypothetical protein